MKAYRAKQSLPGGINKGDIVEYDATGCKVHEVKIAIDYNCVRETEFFSPILLSEDFSIGMDVLITEKLSGYPVNTMFTVFSNELLINRPKATPKIKCSLTSSKDTMFFDIPITILKKYKEYYFINSSGEIHKTFDGKDVAADEWRKLTGNVFDTKQKAIDYKDYTLKTIIPPTN